MANQATKPTVMLRNRNHQPTKAEVEESISVHVPGDTVAEKMANFGKAVTRPVNLKYARK